jgi:hypothetical protein
MMMVTGVELWYHLMGITMEHKRKIMTKKIWYLDVCLKIDIYTDILTWKDTLSCGFTI